MHSLRVRHDHFFWFPENTLKLNGIKRYVSFMLKGISIHIVKKNVAK
jgi:hypothetical protein